MNEYYLHNAEAGETGSMQCDWQSTVKKLSHCFNSGPGNPAPIDLTKLIASSSSRGSVNREMIVEIALLDSLKHQNPMPSAPSVPGITWHTKLQPHPSSPSIIWTE